MSQLTARARTVLQLANREAQWMNHEYIGTEHLLLGLMKEGGGVGCAVLRRLGIDLVRTRKEILAIVQHGPDMITLGTLPQTPRAKRCIEFAVEEATRTGRPVGTGEMLLGLLREQEGVASQVLMTLGILAGRTLDGVRQVVDAETLRAADDAPADSLRNGVDVAGRQRLVWQGAVRGIVGGLMWSVPVGLVCALSMFTIRTTSADQWNLAIQTFVWTVLTWTSIAASVGAQRGREDAMSPHHRTAIQKAVARAALWAALFSSPVVAFFIIGTWGYGPIGAVLGGLTIMGIWVGCAAAVGHGRGSREVAKLQERERAEVDLFLRSGESGAAGDAWDGGTLALKRRALEAAIASRFGPLDEARREKVQQWDQGQIAEAARKLPGAATVEDVDP